VLQLPRKLSSPPPTCWIISRLANTHIHESQIRLQPNFQATRGRVFCDVVNIQRGQLALRLSPNGKSKAGLNNGNTVKVIGQEGIWDYVRVMQGANSRVNGLEGWVNSNYLSCYDNY
jgi:hypothetical protein